MKGGAAAAAPPFAVYTCGVQGYPNDRMPQGRISRYLYGVEFSARDMRLGLVEASEGKIGSAVDQALLFCFHYDPSTGKYSAAVLNLIRLGGIITVLSFSLFVIASRKKDQKSHV